MGLSVLDIAGTINNFLSGESTITVFKEEGRDYDVKARLLEDYRDELLKRDPEEKMLRFQWEQSVKTVEDAIEKIQNKSK